MSEYTKLSFRKGESVAQMKDRLVEAVAKIAEEKAGMLREEETGPDNEAWYYRKKMGQWEMEAQGLREQLAFLASMGLEEARI
mgnify:FL=1